MVEMLNLEGFDLFIDTDCIGLGAELKIQGVYERDVGKFIVEKCEGQLGTFLDVGCHVGYFTQMALSVMRPGSCSFGIEPYDFLGKLFRVNQTLNENRNMCDVFLYDGVFAYNMEVTGRHSLEHKGNTGSGFITIATDGQLLGKRLDRLVGFNETIPCCKIDVQGLEPEVLEGMADMLQTVKAIVCERPIGLAKDVFLEMAKSLTFGRYDRYEYINNDTLVME